MSVLSVGRICVKKFGREAGRKCVIIDTINKNFVLITGPKSITSVKRRRSNINHLIPTQEKIKIKRRLSDEELIEKLKASGKLEFLSN
jgi:large subunit ribosomal protein L14e